MPRLFLALALMSCLACRLSAAEPIKSGLQVGDRIPTAFDPLNINGEYAGQKHCLVCENGLSPVVMVFARTPSEAFAKLVAKVDAATAKNRKHELGSFAVFFGEQDNLEKPLTEIAKKSALKHFILSIHDEKDLKEYKIAKDADVTVMLYVDHDVKANFAFKKGELSEEAIDKIVNDLPKILPK